MDQGGVRVTQGPVVGDDEPKAGVGVVRLDGPSLRIPTGLKVDRHLWGLCRRNLWE